MFCFSSAACLSIWWPMIIPAAPPTTAPRIAPFAVDPLARPIAPPATAPPVAPMMPAFSLLLSDAQPLSTNDAAMRTVMALWVRTREVMSWNLLLGLAGTRLPHARHLPGSTQRRTGSAGVDPVTRHRHVRGHSGRARRSVVV